ncbi:MAG: Rhodanese-like domain [Chloroflexi bacterium]|nr:Rhodanese-like domain [Chloroflexota bacterium]
MPLTAEQRLNLDRKGVNWRRLDYAEASDVLDALDRGKSLVVDTRDVRHYVSNHFPGAVSARGYDALLALPKEPALYLYCACEDDGGASRAALGLMDSGYLDVHVIAGGLYALQDEAGRRGLPTSEGTDPGSSRDPETGQNATVHNER